MIYIGFIFYTLDAIGSLVLSVLCRQCKYIIETKAAFRYFHFVNSCFTHSNMLACAIVIKTNCLDTIIFFLHT